MHILIAKYKDGFGAGFFVLLNSGNVTWGYASPGDVRVFASEDEAKNHAKLLKEPEAWQVEPAPPVVADHHHYSQ